MAFDPTELHYRPGTADDAVCLGVLATQVFLDTYCPAGIRPSVAREVLSAYSTSACANWLARSDTRFEVAELEGHLVGFSQTILGSTHALAPAGTQAELLRLYVQQPFIGHGIGRTLLRRAEGLAAAAGVQVFWLTAWVHNEHALAFYARQGWQDGGQTWFEFENERHENRLLVKRLESAT